MYLFSFSEIIDQFFCYYSFFIFSAVFFSFHQIEKEEKMFRSQQPLLYWKGVKQLTPASSAMWGRRKHERKLGAKRLLWQLIAQSRYRNDFKRPWERSINRAVISAVANENGTDWTSLSKDLARQNIVVGQEGLTKMAQFEPLAFRCLLELASSGIAPPPNISDPKTQTGLKELYHQTNSSNSPSSVDDQLRVDIARMLKPKSALKGSGNAEGRSLDEILVQKKSVVDEWADAWKEFEKK